MLFQAMDGGSIFINGSHRYLLPLSMAYRVIIHPRVYILTFHDSQRPAIWSQLLSSMLSVSSVMA